MVREQNYETDLTIPFRSLVGIHYSCFTSPLITFRSVDHSSRWSEVSGKVIEGRYEVVEDRGDPITGTRKRFGYSKRYYTG